MTRTTDSEIPFTAPMECLPVNELPDNADRVYELKLDGFRGQAIRDNRGVRLLSKNGKDFSKKFPQVFAALPEALPIGTAVDGELVAFDKSGQSTLNPPELYYMAENFFAYGRWDAPFWFIGPEAGMGKDGKDNLAARYESWKQFGVRSGSRL
jgi:hypothetical protein